MDIKPWKSVYLAGPIDFSPDCPGGWRVYAAQRLKEYGVICFNPFNAFNPAPTADRSVADYVRRINDYALASSNVMLLRAEPSLGSGRELAICERYHIPVVAFGSKALSSYTLLPSKNIKFFGSVEDAIDSIAGV